MFIIEVIMLIKIMYNSKMVSVFGIFFFVRNDIIGLNKKKRKLVMRIGKNKVEINILIGRKINEICL